MIKWFATTGKPVHLILTKADKFSRMQALQRLKIAQKWCEEHYPSGSAQLLSGLRKQGVEETYATIQDWIKL
jgi:GTP-binding protein